MAMIACGSGKNTRFRVPPRTGVSAGAARSGEPDGMAGRAAPAAALRSRRVAWRRVRDMTRALRNK